MYLNHLRIFSRHNALNETISQIIPHIENIAKNLGGKFLKLPPIPRQPFGGQRLHNVVQGEQSSVLHQGVWILHTLE